MSCSLVDAEEVRGVDGEVVALSVLPALRLSAGHLAFLLLLFDDLLCELVSFARHHPDLQIL